MTDSSRDTLLDEVVEQTFPASDAPGNTVVTGVRVASSTADQPDRSTAGGVTDNRAASRFELVIEGAVAFLQYERRDNSLVFVHTEVPPSLRGRRIGDALVKAGLAAARAEGRSIVAVCPFVRAYLHKHAG